MQAPHNKPIDKRLKGFTMNLTINAKAVEQYKIKVGAEVYKVNYPSWNKSKDISRKEADILGSEDGNVGEKYVEFIVDTLKELGLDAKFFELEVVTSSHVMQVWKEVNAVKK